MKRRKGDAPSPSTARKDAVRMRALVELIEMMQRGEVASLGDVAQSVFGWPAERVFLAIYTGLKRGLLEKPTTDGQIRTVKR